MNAAQCLADRPLTPEQLHAAHKAYLRDTAPLLDALAKLIALQMPRVLVLNDGTLSLGAPEFPPQTQAAIETTQRLLRDTAIAYRLAPTSQS